MNPQRDKAVKNPLEVYYWAFIETCPCCRADPKGTKKLIRRLERRRHKWEIEEGLEEYYEEIFND